MKATLRVWVAGSVLVLLSSAATTARASVLNVPGQYSSIQGAIDAATPGDRIRVQPGNYAERLLVQKDVVIESVLGPLVTTVDGSGQGATVTFRNVGTGAAIAGFTITGGQGGAASGGGVWVDGGSPRIVRCIITGNDAPRGGGLRLEEGQTEVRNCLVTGNTGTSGAGIHCIDGGLLGGSNTSSIIGCTITANSGHVGGGLHLKGSAVTMVNSIVAGNTATHSDPAADNVAVTEDASLTVDYSNIEGGPSSVYVTPAADGLFWGAGNLSADRLFVDPAAGDFHLQLASSLVDGGDPAFVPLPGEVDLDGDPRVIGSRVDIGADETQGDCNGNGIPDPVDTAAGTSADCNGNAIPDECEPDCNGNGLADGCDISFGLGADCNGNGVLDECDFAAGTSADCDGSGVPDECEIAWGVSTDCNGNGIPDACDLAAGTSSDACNGNAVPDECELDCINASTSVLFELTGSDEDDYLGFQIGILGDVDGDGRDDVFAGKLDSSPLTVFSGVDGSALYAVAHGEDIRSAASAGDLDGDGIPDLVLGMPYAHKVQIHSGFDGSLLQVLTGSAFYGWSVSGGADVDGDGVPDVVVGAPRAGPYPFDPNADGVALIHSGVDGSVIRTLSCAGGCLLGFAGNPGAGDQFGKGVALAGDLDLDGHAEVMVSYQAKDCTWYYPDAPGCSNQPSGVRIYSGSDGSLMFDFPKVGVQPPSMAGVGDVNADGVPDFGIAGANASYGARVFSGVDGALLLAIMQDVSVYSTLSIAGAGDLDGDGRDDLVIGAPIQTWWTAPGGGVSFHSGQDGRRIARYFEPHTGFGWVVAGGGDLDGDGDPDVLASDPFFGAGAKGRVWALTLSGSTVLSTTVSPTGPKHGR